MQIVFPRQADNELLQRLAPATPFHSDSTALLEMLGRSCLHSQSAPLAALGFWLRPAHLKQMQLHAVQNIRPRGRVVQIAPGNVDTLFIYVALLALWLGNVVVVRLSSRGGDDEGELLMLLEGLRQQPQYADALSRLVLLRCEYEDPEWLKCLTAADMRIFWGSDQTLLKLASLPKAPHCQDLAFGHKHSLCLLNAAAILADRDGDWAGRFVRDTLEFEQQGCTSPRTLIWLGTPDAVNEAKQCFWQGVNAFVRSQPKESAAARRYQLSEAGAMERLIGLQQLALNGALIAASQQQGRFVTVPVDGLNLSQEQGHPAQGVLFEWQIDSLSMLLPELRPHHQTLGFYGFQRDELVAWAVSHAVAGLDRIEPLGQALVFHPIWDGSNLIQQLVRQLR